MPVLASNAILKWLLFQFRVALPTAVTEGSNGAKVTNVIGIGLLWAIPGIGLLGIWKNWILWLDPWRYSASGISESAEFDDPCGRSIFSNEMPECGVMRLRRACGVEEHDVSTERVIAGRRGVSSGGGSPTKIVGDRRCSGDGVYNGGVLRLWIEVMSADFAFDRVVEDYDVQVLLA
ncbi:hypothetical protein BDZ91DRAFT_760581 [Kalaharituber pfeilii]|nr:hypothetical protein BDZ91DRAFT_760581 [Kalaharituber pfeilii]